MDAESRKDPEVHNPEIEQEKQEESRSTVPENENLERENSGVEESFTDQGAGQEHLGMTLKGLKDCWNCADGV